MPPTSSAPSPGKGPGVRRPHPGDKLNGHRPTQLDRELHLGHRRRCSPRRLCARQIPRCHPAHDRAAPPRCRAGADQAGRARHEGRARQATSVTNQDDAAPRRLPARRSTTPRLSLLRDLKSRATQQQLKDDFEAYLDGFSPNVQDILDNFEFRNQIPRLSKADALGQLIEKFLDKDINLSPTSPTRRQTAARPRQPRDGHDVRGTGPPLQRGEQRRGRRTLDAARCRAAHGESDLPAHRRPDRVRHLPAL